MYKLFIVRTGVAGWFGDLRADMFNFQLFHLVFVLFIQKDGEHNLCRIFMTHLSDAQV